MDLTDADLSSEQVCLECEQPATYRCWIGNKEEGTWMYFCFMDHASCCEEIK